MPNKCPFKDDVLAQAEVQKQAVITQKLNLLIKNLKLYLTKKDHRR